MTLAFSTGLALGRAIGGSLGILIAALARAASDEQDD